MLRVESIQSELRKLLQLHLKPLQLELCLVVVVHFQSLLPELREFALLGVHVLGLESVQSLMYFLLVIGLQPLVVEQSVVILVRVCVFRVLLQQPVMHQLLLLPKLIQLGEFLLGSAAGRGLALCKDRP